ncbi:MAG: AAA family ATPase [Patescibacteria group bacterium]|nr:AAA family ATPase [Patescibacteria group bacterium]
MTQAEALTILKTGANVFLTGEPGAGKSHTVNEFVARLRQHGIEPAITASTGIAATHIGGMTIHSWCGIGIKRTLNQYDLDRIASSEHVVKRMRRTKILIIDEVSMLSPDTLSMVDAVCREVLGSSRAFGGLQIIFVGDFFQLPPIVKRQEAQQSDSGLSFDSLEDSRPRFAYDSDAWAHANPVVCYLTEQHRQDDKIFLDILSAIRRNSFGEEHLEHIEARKVSRGKQVAGATKLFSHNADVDRLNDETLGNIAGTPKSFVMQSQGAPSIVAALIKSCLSPEALFLKVGASVMFTKNNPKEGYVNGTLGTVVSFNSFNSYPTVETRAGRMIEVEPMDWTVEEGGKIRARITQLPLRLAWAITVHKSQGMSLDEAVMDLSDVFEFGQGYVALSRVRRLSGLHLLGWNKRTFEVHPEVLAKDEQFREASEEAAEAFEKIGADELRKMQENFIKACGGRVEKVERTPKTTGRLAQIREAHPNAYRPWDEAQDKQLTTLFQNGIPQKEISKTLGRQSGSIRARLIKLGLIEEVA